MRLFGRWYLVKDTGKPADYPPKAREELVSRRQKMYDREVELARSQGYGKKLW